MLIYTPDTLRAAVEAASGGRVTVLYDAAGAPSYMSVIPKFTYEDLGLDGVLGSGVATAFSVNGVEKSEIFIGQYLASVVDGRALSLPGRAPRAFISYHDAKAACAAKGPGWHLMSAHEWAAIALWCKVNGSIPRGNTEFGRAHNATHETGHVVSLEGMPPEWSTVTATGSGPATWRHDGTISGISDLVGNLFEWSDLLKTVNGQILTTQDNYDSGDWDALDHYIAVENFTDPQPLSQITLQHTPPTPVTELQTAPAWSETQKAPGYIESQLLNRLLVSPIPATAMQGGFGAMNQGTFHALRGGHWATGGDSGLAGLYLAVPAEAEIPIAGFRPAFIL